MSFNVVLTTNNVYATNTANKDFTWAYNFSNIDDGPYLVSFSFVSNNIAQSTFSTQGPIQISCDFGNQGNNYLAGSLVSSTTSQILGSLKLDWKSATVATLVAGKNDNYPVLFKNINKNTNFIRIHLDLITGVLVTTGVSQWVVVLNFQKVPSL